MAQGLGLEEIIDISTTVQAGGTIRTEFGTGLLITRDNSLSAGGARKALYFRSSAAVKEAINSGAATNSQVEHDADVWFGADPAPKALYIGRWADADVNTEIVSGTVAASQADIQAITDGSFSLNGEDVGSITFAGSNGSNFTQIATTLTTAINSVAGISGATVAYNSSTSKFTIDLGSTADTGLFAATGSGTDLSTTLALNADGGAVYNQGSDSETIQEAVTRCVALASGGAPTALMLGSDIPDSVGSVDVKAAMRSIAQAGDFMFAMLDTSNAALQPLGTGTGFDSTSALAAASTAGQSHVIPVYSRGANAGEDNAPRPDIGIMAKLSSQNFDLPQSIITLVPKSLPSVSTSSITSTQLQTLESKRASVYADVGGLPSLLGGTTAAAGIWADAQWWLLWLKNETERTVFEAMRSSNRLNNAQLIDALSGVMTKAVRSGGAKPGGKVNNSVRDQIRAATGNYAFDGVLRNGFVIWVDPPQNQTDADRAARISRFTVWVAPSEAIHEVGGSIILSG